MAGAATGAVAPSAAVMTAAISSWPIGPPTFLVGQVRVAIRHLRWPVRVQQGNCAAADLSGSAGDRITRALSGETAEELRDFIEELAGAAG